MLDVKKILKKAVKRKIKITEALVVAFLISGNLLHALEIKEDYTNNDIETTTFLITQNDINFTNKGTININYEDQSSQILSKGVGNGILLASGISGTNITSSGVISGNFVGVAKGTTVEGEMIESFVNINDSGNGIHSNDLLSLENLSNDGMISGAANISGGSADATAKNIEVKAEATFAGNGVVSVDDTKDIINKGVILGNIKALGGEGKGEIVNAFAKTMRSGNGIHLKGSDKTSMLSNTGLISGSAEINGGNGISNTGNSEYRSELSRSGNGIYADITTGPVINQGAILGSVVTHGGSGSGPSSTGYVQSSSSGHGLYLSRGMESFTNKGLVSGNIIAKGGEIQNGGIMKKAHVKLYSGGSGFYTASLDPVGNILNEGVASGYAELHPGTVDGKKDYTYFSSSGTGIVVRSKLESSLINYGLTKGNFSAIAIEKAETVTGKIENYGILAGRKIIGNGTETIANDSGEPQVNLGELALSPEQESNYGLYITLKSEMNGANTTGNVVIGSDGKVVIEKIDTAASSFQNGKYIINGTTLGDINKVEETLSGNLDLFVNSSKLTQNNNLVINGVGRATGALTVDTDTNLENSIINGYETALHIMSGKSFTGIDVIFNGGGLKNDEAIIKGDNGANSLEILGNSIINGAADMGDGDDMVTIAGSVQINGNLLGGDGTDTLNLGTQNPARQAGSLSIFNTISGFENLNTNGDVTLFETAKIVGANNINIESGNLTLRVDPTQRDSDNKIIGHALYGNKDGSITPMINSTGGNLVIGLNGLGENSIVNMGGTQINPSMDTEWWKPTDHLITDSVVLDAKLQDDGNVMITVKEWIPLEPPIIYPGLYEDLNKIYQSIVGAGEIGVLANTTLLDDKTYEEALGGLLTILDQIYANNPYAYSLKSSRDSLKLFEDNLSYLTIKPKENEWIVQGKGFYSGVKNDNSDSGKGHYGFDTGHRNYKTTTSFGGGLATAEYGLTNDSSVGFVLGGGHQNTDFKGSSKIKGNTLYLGAFAKKEINQLKLMSGIGYQYGSLKGERVVNNKYDYFKTDDRYDVNSFNAFAEVKYDYALNNDWTLSPKAKLSWYYVSQDSVNEGYEPGNLSLKVDSATGNTGDLEIGFDLKNTLALNSGKLSNILSIGLINTIGDREKELTGNILGAQKNGNSFDIKGIELPRTSGKLSYNLEYEKTNGMIYTLGLGYEFAKDNNKNVTGTVGLGYKF